MLATKVPPQIQNTQPNTREPIVSKIKINAQQPNKKFGTSLFSLSKNLEHYYSFFFF